MKQLAVVKESQPDYEIYANDTFIVGPTSQNAGTHYYVYYPKTLAFKGCLPMRWFNIVSDLAINEQVEVSVVQEAEQMSLFD